MSISLEDEPTIRDTSLKKNILKEEDTSAACVHVLCFTPNARQRERREPPISKRPETNGSDMGPKLCVLKTHTGLHTGVNASLYACLKL